MHEFLKVCIKNFSYITQFAPDINKFDIFIFIFMFLCLLLKNYFKKAKKSKKLQYKLFIILKYLNKPDISLSIDSREMILPSLDASRRAESNELSFIPLRSLDDELT
jgi:hypothetical protein